MQHTGSRRALIIGGGVAGPAVGLALSRVGIESVVFEATPTPRDLAGAFLNLAPNGLRVLEALGATGDLADDGFRNDRLAFRNDAGRTLAEVPVGGATVMRGALSRAIRNAAVRAGVQFEFGKSLATIVDRSSSVVARFSDGTEREGFALIGADGIHSRTRSSWFPNAPAPAYTGIINLGGIVRTDLPPTGRTMHMIFGRRAFFGYAVRPSGETYWFSNFAQPNEPGRHDLEAVSGDQYRDQLIALHRDDPPEVARILRAITGEVGAYAIYDIESLPEWHRGRVCLIGDAAHAVGPHVGQGSSLALEDALVVAKCLKSSADPAAAFTSFERQRRERVERVVKYSRRTGKQKVPTGWVGRKFRDFILPVFLKKGAEAAAELYEWEDRAA